MDMQECASRQCGTPLFGFYTPQMGGPRARTYWALVLCAVVAGDPFIRFCLKSRSCLQALLACPGPGHSNLG